MPCPANFLGVTQSTRPALARKRFFSGHLQVGAWELVFIDALLSSPKKSIAKQKECAQHPDQRTDFAVPSGEKLQECER